MDFSVRALSVLAYANGFTLWHYKAEANGPDLADHPQFFAPAADLLAGGDMVLVSSPSGGRIFCVANAGQAHASEPLQAWAILEASGAAGLLAQDQPVQG